MPFQMTDGCSYLAVKDRTGVLVGHYNPAPEATEPGARVSGPYIPEIPDAKQRTMFLRNNLVVEVDGPPPVQPRSLPETPKPTPSKRFRMTGRCDAMWVTDADGVQYMHIADPVIAASSHGARGPLIEWIERGQRDAYLLSGWIVEIDPGGRLVDAVVAPEEWTDQVRDSSGRSLSAIIAEATAPLDLDDRQDDEPPLGVDAERVLAALAELDVDLAAGAPAVRKKLRDNNIGASNAVIAEVVKVRRAAALAGSA